MSRLSLLGMLMALLLIGAAGKTFLETFDGSPPAPIPFSRADWDIQVHSRDSSTWQQLEPMTSQHGPDCSPPPATHTQPRDYDSAVFQCRDHVMTAITAGGYGVVYLTPPVVVDFSAGEATISIDVSTLKTSGRDWWDLWIQPFETNLALPLETTLPDLQGMPRNAVTVRMDTSGDNTIFVPKVVRDHEPTDLPKAWWLGYEQFLTPDAARRDKFELKIGRDHVKWCMPDYQTKDGTPACWTQGPNNVTPISPALTWTSGLVSLGHHSYNPGKAPPINGHPATANTWHWDNLTVSPSNPITLLRGTPHDLVNTPGRVDFPAPAPIGSLLRFAAVGTIELSLDNGASWQPARRQEEGRDDSLHAHSYWHPIPAGVKSVMVRGTPTIEGWYARDFSVMSLEPLGGVQTPTPTPTVQPVAASTPTGTPTAVPSATATAVPSATATSTPTATATPTAGVCEVRVRIGGIEQWVSKPTTFCQGGG